LVFEIGNWKLKFETTPLLVLSPTTDDVLFWPGILQVVGENTNNGCAMRHDGD